MEKNHHKQIKIFYNDISEISKKINQKQIYKLIKSIFKIKSKKGRIFFIGVGGSAANSSHAVNDFRKLCNIEAYSPADNVSELTARINDEGWNSSFSNWLKISNLNSKDALFVLSVGGGNIKKKVSVNIIEAIKYAKIKKAKIFGIVGRDGGYTKKQGDNVIVIPNINKKNVTPYTEAFQAVIWHSIISHSILKSNLTKW
tara:strand:- start:176 stop:775 length:600 start_codon:yes stop_codon:yes gene_type:complete